MKGTFHANARPLAVSSPTERLLRIPGPRVAATRLGFGHVCNAVWIRGAREVWCEWRATRGWMPRNASLLAVIFSWKSTLTLDSSVGASATATEVSSHDVSIARVTRLRPFFKWERRTRLLAGLTLGHDAVALLERLNSICNERQESRILAVCRRGYCPAVHEQRQEWGTRTRRAKLSMDRRVASRI